MNSHDAAARVCFNMHDPHIGLAGNIEISQGPTTGGFRKREGSEGNNFWLSDTDKVFAGA